MSLRRRVRAEDGQSTIEWLGVAFVVTALIIALAASAGPMGDRVGEAFTCLISRVTGDGAACADASARNREPDFPCIRSSATGSASGSIRVVVVEASTGDVYIREEMSDGTVRVTFVEEGALGLSLEAGAGASGHVNGTGGGAGGSAEVGVAITGAVGETEVFDNADDADQFIQDRITDEAIEALPPVVEVPVSGIRWIIDSVTGHATPQGQDGGSQVSVGVSAEADATGAVGPVRLDGEALAEAGATVFRNPDGSTEITIAAASSGDGAASVVGGVTGSLGVGGSVTISLAPDGRPTAVTLTTDLEAAVGGGLVGLDAIDGLDDSLGALVAETGGRGTVTATLDLTDPALDGDVAALLDALQGAASGVGVDGVVTSVGDLMDGLVDSVTVTVTTHDVDVDRAGLEGMASAGGGLGAEVEIEMVTTQINTAHYWDPAQGRFVPWVTCTG